MYERLRRDRTARLPAMCRGKEQRFQVLLRHACDEVALGTLLGRGQIQLVRSPGQNSARRYRAR